MISDVSTGTLLFPSSPSTAMKAIATLRRAHVAVVQLYTVRIWPLPEDKQGMLSALV